MPPAPSQNETTEAQEAPAPGASFTIEQLLDRHGAYVWRTARYLGVREADLDDVVQEVFVVVHRRLPELRAAEAVRTWIYAVCVRVAANHRRAQRRKREEPLGVDHEPVSDESPLEGLERRQQQLMLRRAIERLDDSKREVFVLFELGDLEMTEVAEVLGCPLKTAYSRLYAARKQVLALVAREMNHAGRRDRS